MKPLQRHPHQRGESLITVMVAIGISAIGFLVTLSMIQNMQRSGVTAQSQSDFGILFDSIRAVTVDPAKCAAAFLDSTGNQVTLEENEQQTVDTIRVASLDVAKLGVRSGSLEVESMSLERLGTGQVSPMKFEITAKKNDLAYGMRTLKKEILIAAVFDSANKITSCGPAVVPPLADLSFIIGSKGDTNTWWCVEDLDLEEYCGDVDGCKVTINMSHELASGDTTLAVAFEIHMEQAELSNQNHSSVYGANLAGYNYTNVQFYSGHSGSPYYTLWGPWDWIYMLTYTHAYCPTNPNGSPPNLAPRGSHSPLPKYHFSFLIHPHVTGRVTIQDSP